jgi:hypothetical protein
LHRDIRMVLERLADVGAQDLSLASPFYRRAHSLV